MHIFPETMSYCSLINIIAMPCHSSFKSLLLASALILSTADDIPGLNMGSPRE
jgi:hypothetical protein